MWTRAQLKEKAKIAFKRNYWKTILISFLMALVVGGGVNGANSGYRFDDTEDNYNVENFVGDTDFEAGLSEGARELMGDSESIEKLYNNELTGAALAGFIAGVVVVVLVAAAVAIAIALVLDAFVINPFMIGVRRFFVSNLNTEAQAKELGYGFDHNYKNIVKTMFLRDLYTVLWSLLFIIPGIVKAYEYRMISYLLAENPNMTKEEAFAMSKQMMTGQKWKAFVLDLSFIGWRILGAITFGIVNIFYVDPYKNMTDAALYEALKMNHTAPYVPQEQTIA